jgi:stalled ribosome alternative rescue factor ArfA
MKTNRNPIAKVLRSTETNLRPKIIRARKGRGSYSRKGKNRG